MNLFKLGKSKVFGDGKNVLKGNTGADFWGKGLFRYDGSLMDKQNLLKSVSNFVRILTGKNISVRYCEEGKDESYTDGKSVTISGNIQPHCLDSTVGLALHEGSHIVKTDFKVIRNLMDKKNIEKKYHDYTKFIKNLHNWVEDRRIDYNTEVTKALTEHAAELSQEKAHHYEFFIINSLHPDVKMTELNGLPEIEAIIDIDNPQRWNNTTDTLQDSLAILDVILKNIPDEEKEKLNDTNYHPGELTDEQLNDLIKKILNGQQKFLDGEPVDGDGKAIKIEVDAKTAQLLDALLKSDTKIEAISKPHVNQDRNDDGEWNVVTVNHIDEDTIKSGLYSIFSSYNRNGQEELIRQGLNLGTMLGRKLKIRNDERTLRTVKLKTGKIDRRNLHSAGYGSSDIFFNVKEDKYNDMGVHLSVDMSGSMSGDKWNNTLISLVAISKACSMIRGIRVQISLRYGGNVTGGRNHYSDEAIVVNFYDSAFDGVRKLALLRYASPSGSTPEGLCYEALAKKIMKPLLSKDSLFVNFSDGAPGMGCLSTATGVKLTRDVINKFKMHGMSILSYYINESGYEGNDRANFIEMYGKDASFIDVKSLIDLARSINDRFLKMGK